MSPEHPRCRIPPLDQGVPPDGLPPVATESGFLPAERALAYDRPELILYGPAATRPAHTFSLAELAGYSKTATRLLKILDRIPLDHHLQPLEWIDPQQLAFTVAQAALVHSLTEQWRLLEQAEQLHLERLDGANFLLFQRA